MFKVGDKVLYNKQEAKLKSVQPGLAVIRMEDGAVCGVAPESLKPVEPKEAKPKKAPAKKKAEKVG